MSKKNLIVICTDQHQYNGLGCYGNDAVQTPHVDGLARDGLRFLNHYSVNTLCMPSRASFATGRFPQAHRVLDNGVPLPESEVTMAEVLHGAGYRTASVGKLHFTPYLAPAETGYLESSALWQNGTPNDWNGPYYGFEEVQLTLGHGERTYECGGHYGRWVEENFRSFVEGQRDTPPKTEVKELGCWLADIPEEAHSSSWIAQQATTYLQERGKDNAPFYLFVSFPDPHAPFSPVRTWAGRYANATVPPPNRQLGENDAKPLHYQRAMHQRQSYDGGAWRPPTLTDDTLEKITRYYYASISFLDDCIGRVLSEVSRLGLDDETYVVFTSDHGEFLGDHWYILKGPYPCRSLLRVPFILRGPDIRHGEYQGLMSNVDVAPTLLNLLGAQTPSRMQGISYAEAGRDDSVGPLRSTVLASGWSKESPEFYHQTVYTDERRLSLFPAQRDGELYDLEADPHEYCNLYHAADWARERERMMALLAEEIGRAEAPESPAICQW